MKHSTKTTFLVFEFIDEHGLKIKGVGSLRFLRNCGGRVHLFGVFIPLLKHKFCKKLGGRVHFIPPQTLTPLIPLTPVFIYAFDFD
jgi:hypothetical protein